MLKLYAHCKLCLRQLWLTDGLDLQIDLTTNDGAAISFNTGYVFQFNQTNGMRL